VAVWCRQLGHEVHYATYYGQSPPEELLPKELDVVFLATYTQASALAYALARLYRSRGALTVLGGPHATSFPTDSLRFFDLVVHDCDKELIAGILRGDFEPGSVVSSGHALEDVPSVEERMPYIEKASFVRGRPVRMTIVSLLTSLGCPYRCDFCVDWKNDYVMMPSERLLADLRYISEHLPGVLVAFQDPNFGVKFDETLDLIEQIPEGRRNPYIMESSLSILRGPRMHRLRETNCIYTAPGVESWTDYSNKAGVGRSVGHEKLESVVSAVRGAAPVRAGPAGELPFRHGRRPGGGARGADRGVHPAPAFRLADAQHPHPLRGTPMYDRHLAEDRILKEIPFAFYYMPHLIVRPRHYDPLSSITTC
jgi:hypothetical protein